MYQSVSWQQRDEELKFVNLVLGKARSHHGDCWKSGVDSQSVRVIYMCGRRLSCFGDCYIPDLSSARCNRAPVCVLTLADPAYADFGRDWSVGVVFISQHYLRSPWQCESFLGDYKQYHAERCNG